MARICSGCNKFASLDPEVESVEADVTNDGQGGVNVSITAEVVLNSQCCGQEVARASIEDDHDIGAECFTHEPTCGSDGDDPHECDDTCEKDEEGKCPDKEEDEDKASDEPDLSAKTFSCDDIEGDPGERMQDTDRHGRKIKSYRYMRKFYTVDVTGTVTCDDCGAEFAFEATIEEQASGFEDSN